MKRLWVWLAWTGGAAWALVTFLASNSPTDVQQRASGWLALPLIRELPDKLVSFAANPIVFVFTFFALGMVAGWRLTKWSGKRKRIDWPQALSSEMSLLALQINNSKWSSDIHQLNADIDVMRVKATKHGLPFPRFEDGFKTVDSLLPYLTRVSAHLGAGHVDHAKVAAKQLAEKPLPLERQL